MIWSIVNVMMHGKSFSLYIGILIFCVGVANDNSSCLYAANALLLIVVASQIDLSLVCNTPIHRISLAHHGYFIATNGIWTKILGRRCKGFCDNPGRTLVRLL
jgi:hypothetical protein